MRRWSRSGLAGLAALGLLAACGEKELILEGERLDLRPGTEEAAPIAEASPLALGPAVANAAWTHPGGSPAHRIDHPALGGTLTRAWSVDIGEGNGRRHRITADPVVADGRVFTLDSRARVTAVSTAGKPLWSRDLTPASDNPDDASGGGLAHAGGRLYVTSGFGMLTVLDAETGATVWTQDFDAAATGAPLVTGGAVYAVTRNATGWALDAATGRIRWQVLGAPSPSGLAGGPAPAEAVGLVVFPFASGQMTGVVPATGAQAWLASVAGRRLGRAFSRITDIAGGPVSDGARFYASNHSGRTAAFDAATGREIWSAEEGAISLPLVAGGSVFVVSDENRLVRLDAATGAVLWSVDLPLYVKERQSRRKTLFTHYGPVLAGGRLLVASDDGVLRAFDPGSGALISQVELPDGAARPPVVAGGVLYLVTEDGRLHAFR